MQSQGVPLRAAVVNRVQPFRADGVTPAAVAAAIAGLDLDPRTSTWLARTWSEAAALADAENARVRAFVSGLPPGTPWISVPELDHDAHSLADLAELARLLGATD
jgi:hypothetical protein